jgi:ribosomal protein S18 acetylase RimI-like enzyme
MLVAERLTRIRRATPGDAASLAAFAALTFRDAFERDNTPEDMALYLATNYSPARQAAELGDGGIVTLVADAGDVLAGFAQLREGTAPECVTGPRPIELWRFYVARAWHGRGLAQGLMASSLEAAAERGAGTIWLAVWERNERALAFYRKCGFEVVGDKEFVLGTDRQTDRVMARSL